MTVILGIHPLEMMFPELLLNTDIDQKIPKTFIKLLGTYSSEV